MKLVLKILFLALIISPCTWLFSKSYASLPDDSIYKPIKDFYFKSNGAINVNQLKKYITAKNGFILIRNGSTYTATNLHVWYTDIKNLNFEHINKIEAINNVKIVTNNQQTITGYKYVYDKALSVHLMEGAKNVPVVYKDSTRTLVANNRIEYFINKNIMVVRGNPTITAKNSDNSTYYISSNLMNAQLEDNKLQPNKKNIVFIEAINNVKFKDKDNDNTITADYAIYYQQEQQIEFTGNIKFTSNNGTLNGCKAFYNLKTHLGRILPCDVDKSLEGTINTKSKSKKLLQK